MKNFFIKLFVTLSVLLILSCKTQEKSIEHNPFTADQDLEIQVEDTIFLSGTLSFANNSVLAIMIAGSGPTDRKCNNETGLNTDAFRLLADSLKLNGISSFRYDKRGIARSTPVHESQMVIGDLVNDVLKIVRFFEGHFDRIVLIGHSEGALITKAAAHQTKEVDGIVLLCGISTTLDKIIEDQLARYPRLLELAIVHLDEIRDNKALSEVHVMLRSLFRESVVPYLKSAFDLDPIEEISKVKQDIMIVGGRCDVQVPPNHADSLKAYSEHATKFIYEDMGHCLKHIGDDCMLNAESYSNPEIPLHSQMTRDIVVFISNQ
ncbi:MAG: alpha/beta hydrolase [Saprospiraceae bacterium]|nr:alpha/beta hydrolase [Saprospiraceae bacterium]